MTQTTAEPISDREQTLRGAAERVLGCWTIIERTNGVLGAEGLHTTALTGYWDCDCGRECRHKEGPDRSPMCRAEWVQITPAGGACWKRQDICHGTVRCVPGQDCEADHPAADSKNTSMSARTIILEALGFHGVFDAEKVADLIILSLGKGDFKIVKGGHS